MSYEDLQLIAQWLQICPDVDQLLLHLSDIIPSYFDKARKSGRSGSLKGVSKSVLKRLKEASYKGFAATSAPYHLVSESD